MASKRKTSTAAKRGGSHAAKSRKRAKPRPDMDEKWSILLFGAGIAVLALTYVPGSEGWAWVRTNILFGLFGVSAYLLGPLMLYAATLVAMRRPVYGAMAKGALLMALVSGAFLVFSKTDMSGYNFSTGIPALFATGAVPWGLGGGVLSALFGWTLLALCGRPGANILLVIFVIIGMMLLTGCTPAHIYYFLSRRASGAKDSLRENAAVRAEQRAVRNAERELRLEAERAAREEAQRMAAQQQTAQIDEDAFARAKAAHEAPDTRAPFDIDLGPDLPMEHATGQSVEKAVIGPGGTFGLDALNELAAEHAAQSAPSAAQAMAASAAAEPVPAPDAADAQLPLPAEPEEESAPSLDSIVAKAAGTPTAVPSRTAPEEQQAEQAGYAYPPLSLFQKQKPDDVEGVQEELRTNAELLVKTLSSFGVQTRILDISRGPSVTRYELQPLAGVKISRITGLADDIALNLAATGVRIEAPIPGKAAVGVEIPNKHRTVVTIRSIFESPEFTQSRAPLTFALGMDIAGKCQVGNLAKMPHLLIAGTTGSGKSVCTNSIIMSMLYRCSPDTLRLMLIDPKMVEFAQYNGIPHLLMPVVTEPRKAAGALGSAVAEMEKRYRLLADNGVPNIEEYNALAETNDTLEKMPYIVIVIDELADLMMVAGKEVEDYICRIAQKARAAGMHLVIATQRPSVDVITGLIKANIPSRIGLSVMSQVDSRTILDTGGAEKMLGNGDMLYKPVGVNNPIRVQGTFVRSAEIHAVIDFLKKHSGADYDEAMIAEMEKRAAPEKSGDEGSDSGDRDPMFDTAVETVIEAGQASTSFLQRRCKLGYSRAARIMDEMEQMGIIGPSEGSKPRQVLISRQQWIEMMMAGSSEE